MRWSCWALLCALSALSALTGARGTSCPPADRAMPRADNSSLDGSCAACRLRSEVRELSLAAIRQHVLARLGFAHAPNTTGRVLPSAPRDMLLQFERGRLQETDMQADQPGRFSYQEDEDDFHARMEKVIAFPQQRFRHLWKSNRVLYYRFAEKVMQNQVTEAFLHVYIRDAGPRQDPEPGAEGAAGADELLTVTVQVSRVTKNNDVFTSSVVATADAAMSRAEQLRGKWLKVNVTRALAEWFLLPRSVLGLVVRAQDSERRRLAVPEGKGDVDNMPYLEVFLEDTSRRRTKRTVGLNCNDNSQETRCCRYPLKVDFEEFGWDWIIAPKTYEANFCMGDCPYAFLQKYPSTHVIHLAAPAGYGGPCCTPRKMSAISLLHFTHEFNIALNSLPAMVVEKCGCT